MQKGSRVRVGRANDRNQRRVSGHPASEAGPEGAPTEWNEYRIADARNISQLLGDLPIVDVTVTSPPYWDIKNYGGSRQIGYRQSLDQYLEDLVSVFSAVWRCTRPGGSLWVVMKSVKKDGRLHLLPFLLSQRLTSLGAQSWHLQDVLIWYKTHTLPWSHRQKLPDNYEHILCFSKSKEFSLRLDAVRSSEGISNWWVKYPERYHPHGKTLNNVWEIAIPTQGSWGNGHFSHSCPLPVELVKRIILLASDEGGTVLDPFAGTGSTALAANTLGRKWLAVDINRKYRDMFCRRLAHESPEGNGSPSKSLRDLAEANLSLRQLKYGLLIYKRVAPGLRLTTADIPLIFVQAGQPQRSASPHWVKGGRVTVVLTDGCYRSRRCEISAQIQEICGMPPLSKFQLDVSVDVESRTHFFRKKRFADIRKLYLYTGGNFWSSAAELQPDALATATGPGKLPLIASDLLVREQPAY